MSKRDHKTGNATPSRETPHRNVGLRHLLETDRMRLPYDPVEALEQLLREMGWLVQMIKVGGEAK
jgi:hypothetical protein